MGPLSSVLPRLRLCLVSAGSPEMGFPERNTWPLTAPSPRGLTAHPSPQWILSGKRQVPPVPGHQCSRGFWMEMLISNPEARHESEDSHCNPAV